MARRVQVEIEIEPDQWAALEAVAKRSGCTVEDSLEGLVNTALIDLAIEESRGDPVALTCKVA